MLTRIDTAVHNDACRVIVTQRVRVVSSLVVRMDLGVDHSDWDCRVVPDLVEMIGKESIFLLNTTRNR